MIKKVEEIVTEILTNSEKARDNDELLCALVWRKQVGHRIDYLTVLEFLQKMAAGKFHKAESIMRCRRKLQELHEDLRGKKYEKRRRNMSKVKDELKTMDAESTGPSYSSAPIQRKLL
jgi:hypothetical protein